MISFIKGLKARWMGRLSSDHQAGLMGVGWSTLSQIVSLFVRLGSTLILTRLLAPEEYGILGTALAVLTTLEWLSDLGIHPALIRHKNGGTPEYLLTGWWMGVGRGTLLSLSAALVAWPLAAFYNEPSLFAVLLVLSLRPLLFAVRSPSSPMMEKDLDYKAVFIDEAVVTVVGTMCSIAMALVFRNVWAIVLGTMAGAFASVIVTYILYPMRPRFCWDRRAVKDIYGLGAQVFWNTLIMAAWLNLDRLLGLRLLSPAEMGVYAIAFNLAAVAEGLATRFCDVYFSLLAKEEDSEARSAWHRMMSNKVATIGMPLVALSILASPWAIWILYDPRYAGAGVLLAILLCRLMVRIYGQLQFQYLMSIARVKLATYAYLIAVGVHFAALFPLVSNFGVMGMAISVLVSTVVMTLAQELMMHWKIGGNIRAFSRTLAWSTAGVIALLSIYSIPTAEASRSTSMNERQSQLAAGIDLQ